MCSTPLPHKAFSVLQERLNIAGMLIGTAVYVGLLFLSTAYLVNETYNPFLYFRF
jgi:alginate O-acetyltransferase complex protein AlgI